MLDHVKCNQAIKGISISKHFTLPLSHFRIRSVDLGKGHVTCRYDCRVPLMWPRPRVLRKGRVDFSGLLPCFLLLCFFVVLLFINFTIHRHSVLPVGSKIVTMRWDVCGSAAIGLSLTRQYKPPCLAVSS